MTGSPKKGHMPLSVTPPLLDQKNDLIHTVSVGNQVPHFRFVHKDNGVRLYPVHETVTKKTLQPFMGFKNKYK